MNRIGIENLSMFGLDPVDIPIGLEIPIRSEALAGIGPRERLGRMVAATRRLLGGKA